MTKTLICIIIILTACSPKTSKQNLFDLLKKNSKNNHSTFFQLDKDIDFEELTKLDTVFFKALAKYEVLSNRGCNDCPVQLYYYSYFKFNRELTAAIFAKENNLQSGASDQLIMALLDREGQVINAFIAAEITNFAECNYFTTTSIKDTVIIQTDKEDCVITSGQSEGLSSIDSTTYFYSLTNGHLKLNGKTNNKIER
ncbi:MAG: hypothetical protein KF900_09825 [Bacteroidetes bacterium]|nr:hypothetical protein [Bacteroidota bacterium]